MHGWVFARCFELRRTWIIFQNRLCSRGTLKSRLPTFWCPFLLALKKGDEYASRAGAVCAGCLDGCGEGCLDSLSFSTNRESTMPAGDCKEWPTGVNSSSEGTLVTTLELRGGYYRTSNTSHTVLECHRQDSCVGGPNASEYCSDGYKGPCESYSQRDLQRLVGLHECLGLWNPRRCKGGRRVSCTISRAECHLVIFSLTR